MFKRIELNYQLNALEPYISRSTMDNHYNVLHWIYEDNLKKVLESQDEISKKYPDLKSIMQNLEHFPPEIREKVRYNAGGLINHNFFFSLLALKKSQVSPEFLRTIYRDFGTLENLRRKLIEKALEFTGTASYWTWLIINKEKKLEIINTLNQDNPWMMDLEPLLAIDLFEHAYVIDYRSNKREYMKAVVYNCLDWKKISELYLQKII